MANSLLRFVSYKELVFWDYYSYFSPLIFTTKYRTVKLGDLIRQRKGSIIINDTEEYKRCKVQLYGKGVVVRDIVKGSEIKTKKQQLCKTDDFLVAEIDAKFGGYGIVPKYLENAVVSSHYFLYEINQTLLDINYFSLILKLDEFAKQVVATGSTNYAAIRPYHVLGYEIPLPDMDTQKRLVQQYNNKTDKAQKLEEEANRLEGSIETYLQKELGIEIVENKKEKNGLRFVRFAEIERWDNWIFNDGVLSHIYPKVRLQELVVGNPLYGANEKAVKKVADVRYIRITDINEDGTLNEEFVSAQKVENKYLLNEDDFLIARSGNTVGKTFLYKKSHGRCIFAGYLVKYTLNTKLIYPEFLLCFTKSKAFKAWISSNQRIAGQPNINGQEYLNAKIPLPPMTVQKQVASVIEDIRNQIKSMRLEAETLKVGAKEAFTRELFS